VSSLTKKREEKEKQEKDLEIGGVKDNLYCKNTKS